MMSNAEYVSPWPKVAVVILNWNGRDWLAKFLPSVCATTYPEAELWVVDNGSTDDSLALLGRDFPQVRVLALERNYGFAEGNNRVLPHVDAKYVLLLNSDVEVGPGWLEPLVAAAEADVNVAAVQPKIRSFHAPELFEHAGAAGGWMDALAYPFCRGRVFDVLETDGGQYEDVADVFWASGACMLIRRKVIDEIGLFEPTFFAHMEEIDFCWRAQNVGYRVVCAPQSVVWHVGGGTLPVLSPFKVFLNVRNSLGMMLRNFPAGAALPRIVARLVLDGVWAGRCAWRGDWKLVWAILRAHGAFYGRVPGHLAFRRRMYAGRRLRLPTRGWYGGSVVWAHFGRGKRTFAEVVRGGKG